MQKVLIRMVLIAALLPSAFSPSAAQSVQAESPDSTEKLFEDFEKHFYSQEFAEALAVASRIHPDAENREGRGIVAAMRGAALLGLNRMAEAKNSFAAADRLAPNEPYPSIIQFEAGLVTDNWEIAATALDRMISRMPDVARDLDSSGVNFFLRNEPKGRERQNEDRRIALARLGYGGSSGDYLTIDAMNILVKRGDISGVAELFKYVDDPSLVENLLIQRRYSGLWPAIEKHAGPHLENVRGSSVRAARRELANSPDNAEKRVSLVNALRQSGQLDEAISFRASLPQSNTEFQEIHEDDGWLINEVAFALHQAGRDAEADQLFARLNEAEIKNSRWRVSMIINRLGLLVADGKFDLAAPLIAPTEASAGTDGNAYAKQLVRRLKYCTLFGLGKTQEAATLLPDLVKHADDAKSATIDALLCGEQVETAEKLVLKFLSDDDFQDEFARRLQSRRLTADDPSIWTTKWIALKDRPAVAAAFERFARELPEEYLPANRE